MDDIPSEYSEYAVSTSFFHPLLLSYTHTSMTAVPRVGSRRPYTECAHPPSCPRSLPSFAGSSSTRTQIHAYIPVHQRVRAFCTCYRSELSRSSFRWPAASPSASRLVRAQTLRGGRGEAASLEHRDDDDDDDENSDEDENSDGGRRSDSTAELRRRNACCTVGVCEENGDDVGGGDDDDEDGGGGDKEDAGGS